MTNQSSTFNILVDGVVPPSKKVLFTETASQSSLTDLPTQKDIETDEEKVEYERIMDGDIVEMPAYLVPGESAKEDVSRNYLWKFGRADGQFRVVLGHNTIFKVNGIFLEKLKLFFIIFSNKNFLFTA